MTVLPISNIFSFPPTIQLIYFGLSIIIGVFGINRVMGFWGYMFCSIIFSPLIGLLVLLVSAPKKKIT
jgi:hypothetical protein